MEAIQNYHCYLISMYSILKNFQFDNHYYFLQYILIFCFFQIIQFEYFRIMII